VAEYMLSWREFGETAVGFASQMVELADRLRKEAKMLEAQM